MNRINQIFGGNNLIGIPLGLIFQIIILVALFFVIYWIFKNNKSEGSALEILEKRYAKGEISKKEFLRIKKEIS